MIISSSLIFLDWRSGNVPNNPKQIAFITDDFPLPIDPNKAFVPEVNSRDESKCERQFLS